MLGYSGKLEDSKDHLIIRMYSIYREGFSEKNDYF
jgi:hypothetical protein